MPKYVDHGLKEVKEKGISYNFVMMEYIDMSIQEYLDSQTIENKLSMSQIYLQMLVCIEELHYYGYLHRDIKPDNFRIKNHQVYLIDFGLSRQFYDINTTEHILQYKIGNSIRGTLLTCSINSHLGIELSRKDDLVSLGYTFLYLSLGELPW